jgi:hypothetical protein
MKNFFTTVRKAGPLRTRNAFGIEPEMVDAQGELTLWMLMDKMNEIKSNRIEALKLSDKYSEEIKNINLKLYENAALGDELLIESSFAPNGKKEVDLKVYVSKREKGKPVRRVCKAVYTLSVKAN